MENHKNNNTLSKSGDTRENDFATIHHKLDEFVIVLSESNPNTELLGELQKKFNVAIHDAAQSILLDSEERHTQKASSGELDVELGQLLLINNLDKPAQQKMAFYQIISMVIRVIIALLLILLGFGMIIMPAPPYFEMFTLFYLSPNDGVTIMDVISLIVAFIGVYLLISTFAKRKSKR